jgi:hypothetical protein
MADILFIQPSEMSSTTIMGGNVDIDKYTFCIANVQLSVIEPLLGTLLYDKMLTDFPTYAGDYATLYTDFIKPITKHSAIGDYISIASYTLANGGIYKHQPDNAEIVEKDEVMYISGKYKEMAQMYIQRFEKWICKNPITEYSRSQDEVNARKLELNSGWFFGGSIGLTEDELW